MLLLAIILDYLYGFGETTGQEIFNVNRSNTKYGNASFGAGWSLGRVQELFLTRKDGKTDLLYRDKNKDSMAIRLPIDILLKVI